MMRSTLTRRSLALAKSRGSPATSAAASFGTQTNHQTTPRQSGDALENLMQDLHWKSIKDNVRELRSLMQSNDSIVDPNALLKDDVTMKLAQVQMMINTPTPSTLAHLASRRL